MSVAQLPRSGSNDARYVADVCNSQLSCHTPHAKITSKWILTQLSGKVVISIFDAEAASEVEKHPQVSFVCGWHRLAD